METFFSQCLVFISKASWLMWVMNIEFIDEMRSIIFECHRFMSVFHILFSHFSFCNFFNDNIQLFRLQYAKSHSIIERVTKLDRDIFWLKNNPLSLAIINFNLINDGKVVNIERKSIVYGQSHSVRVWVSLSEVWDTSSSMLVL
jgi:hypothetical protein